MIQICPSKNDQMCFGQYYDTQVYNDCTLIHASLLNRPAQESSEKFNQESALRDVHFVLQHVYRRQRNMAVKWIVCLEAGFSSMRIREHVSKGGGRKEVIILFLFKRM
jgi:hypothetical protein